MISNINVNTKSMSLLIYGCKAWTIAKEAARRINAFETWCYRRILKVSWINKLPTKRYLTELKKSQIYQSRSLT